MCIRDSDNTAGQVAAGYWEASEGGMATVYMVKNIDDGPTPNHRGGIRVHAYVAGHTSKHAIDWRFTLTPGDSTGFLLSISNGALVVTSTETGKVIGTTNTNIEPDAEGIYRGYTIFIVTSGVPSPPGTPSPILGPNDAPLAVSSALITPTYYVGVNCVSVRGADTNGDGTITLGEALPTLNATLNLYSYFGRWYSDEDTYGQLIIVFPAARDQCNYDPETNPIEIRGRNWDEAEHNVSFWMNVDEAERIPITNNYPTSLPFISGVGDATSGWVEIFAAAIPPQPPYTCLNPGMFGFTLMEEPVLGRADALPLFHAMVPGIQ